MTHSSLLRTIWGLARECDLRVAVRALRLELEQDPGTPELIINEPAVGDRLNINIEGS